MKSKSIWEVRVTYGIGDVVSPRAVTYSVTCHEWLVHGVWVRRTLPTICMNMCRVAQVSLQASSGRSGHAAEELETVIGSPVGARKNTRSVREGFVSSVRLHSEIAGKWAFMI